MFSNILEAEIKLKERIVDDFVYNLKPNPLDYNLTTHTMKNKTDYLLLVTKLYRYLDHSNLLRNLNEEESKSMPKSELPTHKPSQGPSCTSKVLIKNAKYVKNPCNN